jgi:hypothetical protein
MMIDSIEYWAIIASPSSREGILSRTLKGYIFPIRFINNKIKINRHEDHFKYFIYREILQSNLKGRSAY